MPTFVYADGAQGWPSDEQNVSGAETCRGMPTTVTIIVKLAEERCRYVFSHVINLLTFNMLMNFKVRCMILNPC